ncbi:PHO85 cyclin-1 [Coemansia sp. RSA 1939]|nr:PHO85 cyclin-1 [Coemansia sp. RSA 1939]KAJ2604464.1 PHO85 cyclin-1 [Coemansia sp. RSA 1804]
MLAASNANSGAFGGGSANQTSAMAAAAAVASASAAAAAAAAAARTQNIHTLYHIPQTLTNFTVNFLSQLFAAVEKPPTRLKRPDISVDTRPFPEFRYFIRTLLINGRISADTLVHALIYLSRFHRRVAGKQAHVEEGAKHKLFLAALLVASKFCDDRYPLASISVCEFLPPGLLTLSEINRMERAFLKVIKYKLIVDPDELALLLRKHGIDIKQIADDIAERLGTRSAAPALLPPPPPVQAVAAMQHLPVPPIALSAASIPQRAVAGHSISARSFALRGSQHVSKPLPPQPM